MGGLANVLFLFSYMFSLFLASCRVHLPFQGCTRLFKILLSRVARSGGRSFSSAPALIFSLLSLGVGGNALRAKRQEQKQKKHNRPKWWKLADSTFRIHFSLPL